jgi:Fe-S cluster biogenesis protein NfuA
MSSNAQPPTGESFLSLQELTLREWLSYCRIKTSLLLLKYHLKSVKNMIMKDEVEKALNEIRPSLQADGGNVELVGIENDIIKVRLTGACAGCPMSQMTLKHGVEQHLKQRVPEISGVEAV